MFHARVMLISSPFTFHYRAQNSPSLFTYQDLYGLHVELFEPIKEVKRRQNRVILGRESDPTQVLQAKLLTFLPGVTVSHM